MSSSTAENAAPACSHGFVHAEQRQRSRVNRSFASQNVTVATSPPGPFLRADRGWFPIESLPALGRTRWMGEQARLYLERPLPAPATVRLIAVSYATPRRIEVRADDAPVGVFTVPTEPTEIVFSLAPAAVNWRASPAMAASAPISTTERPARSRKTG